VADEVPAERVAVDGVLGVEILRAVLAGDLDSTPASARAARSSRETYFVAATTVTPGPTSSRMRS
jgi:hypothetical protein